MFGDSNYHKNDLYESIKEFYKDGGNQKDLFDVLKNVHEYEDTPESVLEERIIKAIDELAMGITFCENDSQGVYDVCNQAIAREKRVIAILRGE